MNKVKRFAALFMTAALALSFSACGSSDSGASDAASSAATSSAASESAASDSSAAASSAAESSSGEAKTLNIAYQSSIAYAPLLVAMEKQMIENAYDGDLTVNYQLMANGSEINEAITAGSIDVGCLGAAPAITGMANGVPYKIFSGLSSQPYALLSNDPAINTLEDIGEGTQIAITNINSHPHILLAMAAKEYLGDAHALDSNLVVLGNADGYSSILTGAVDCHMVISPYNFMEVESEDADIHELEIGKDVWPNGNTFIVGVAGTKLYEEDPDLYQALCDGIDEAMKFIEENPEETAEIIAEGYDATPEEILTWMQDERSAYQTELSGVLELASFMGEEAFLDADKVPTALEDIAFDNVKGN
ncbi:MAG: ABC transporter substrate-binding protein [Eubacterium sp.]|nr:ABC transporter substrate-binding protein [Eubacterium sp.]